MGENKQHKRCWQLMRQRSFKEAIKVAHNLCENYPGNSESWYSLSAAAKGARLGPLALQAINKALELKPNNLEFLAHKAHCLLSNGSMGEAIALARRIKDTRPNSTYVLNTIAVVFQAADEFADQLEITQRIITLAPGNTIGLANYAETLRNIGQLSEAEAVYTKVIALDPSAYSAYWGRSQTFKATQNHNYIAGLSDKLSQPGLPWRAEMQLSFALTKELEDLCRYDESFAYLSRGTNLRRMHANYDVKGDVATIDKIIEAYNTPPPVETGFETDEPIFVLGLPRSGTTLVERILGGHSDILDAGELQSFPTELVKQIQRNAKGKLMNKLASVEASVNLDWRALGKAYLENTRFRTGHTPRFVDKLPSNYLYIGLIARALPKARIVLLERNPMANCYAMYKTLFAEAYPFTYSQSDLGHYYVAWRRLMDHWINLLPDRIFILRYEALVENTETTVRELLDFCGLDWQYNCLAFHRRTGGVSTASSSQVRQPIYKSSLDNWRNYEKQLQPLSDILQAARSGY